MSQDPADQIPVLMPMTKAARDVLVEHLHQTRGGRPTYAPDGCTDDKVLARAILVRAAAMLIGEIDRLDAGGEK